MLDPERMLSAQVHFHFIHSRLMYVPVVYQALAVEVEPGAIVGTQFKAVAAGRDVEGGGRNSGETVGIHAGGRAVPPGELEVVY